MAICVTLTSQFNLNLFVPGFLIAVSGIMLPLLLYLYVDLNPIKVGVAAGIISPLFRGIIVLLKIKDMGKTIDIVAPDVLFYFTYGIVFYYLFYQNDNKNPTQLVITAFWCDFLSNIIEMSARTHILNMNMEIVKSLLLIATVRTLVILITILLMKYYKSFLKREEHERRYRNLVLLTSYFKSEIYFMNKNISEIEDVVKKSYSIYKITSENESMHELSKLSLCIAKDIHEIKKDYIRVIKGIEEISKEKVEISNMNIRDIVKILEIDAKEYIKMNGLDISMDVYLQSSFNVTEHYYLMTVIKNLIYNSIDAVNHRKYGRVTLSVYDSRNEYNIIVSDNGTGIKESNLDYIFNPGFSTKFDNETGDINRGIGLTLVKDLVENTFMGNVIVKSIENQGSTFTIKIPKSTFLNS